MGRTLPSARLRLKHKKGAKTGMIVFAQVGFVRD